MAFNQNLFNAAVIGENPQAAFIADGKRLHAVEQHIADLKKDQSKLEIILPLMRDALNALLEFSKEKLPRSFTEFDQKSISLQPNEKDQLIEKIVNIYTHLHHHDRNELSSLIHHKAAR